MLFRSDDLAQNNYKLKSVKRWHLFMHLFQTPVIMKLGRNGSSKSSESTFILVCSNCVKITYNQQLTTRHNILDFVVGGEGGGGSKSEMNYKRQIQH